MTKPRTSINIALPDSLYTVLKAESIKTGVSMTQSVVNALRRYLAVIPLAAPVPGAFTPRYIQQWRGMTFAQVAKLLNLDDPFAHARQAGVKPTDAAIQGDCYFYLMCRALEKEKR